MQDFNVDDTEFSRSIGFDATKRDDLVVTVGVSLTRIQEALLLDELYREIHADGYLPFRTKSRDLSLPTEKIDAVLSNFRGTIGICIHQDSVKLPYAEATHSAILLNELTTARNDPIVIIDGNKSKARGFHHATAGIDLTPPPVVHCTRSEMYYPHLLLADLVAGRVADEIDSRPSAAYDIEEFGPIAVVENTTQQGPRWSQGYNAAARGKGQMTEHTFEQRSANSFEDRVTCWFHGWFEYQNADPPASDSTTPVTGQLQRMDCTDVAQWIAERE